nr:hypothetical protein HmN_000174300 [Hymenolepis microstoma]
MSSQPAMSSYTRSDVWLANRRASCGDSSSGHRQPYRRRDNGEAGKNTYSRVRHRRCDRGRGSGGEGFDYHIRAANNEDTLDSLSSGPLETPHSVTDLWCVLAEREGGRWFARVDPALQMTLCGRLHVVAVSDDDEGVGGCFVARRTDFWLANHRASCGDGSSGHRRHYRRRDNGEVGKMFNVRIVANLNDLNTLIYASHALAA